MRDAVDARAWQREAFRADVLAGLARARKTLPSRWLYDDRGSELFEEITRLDEYYPTRTETAILRRYRREIAGFCGRDAMVFEYGAGAGTKTEILLGALDAPRLYVPVDIAGDFLDLTVGRIGRRFPALGTRPVVADFTTDFALPEDLPAAQRRTAFFPGSTIGNLSKTETASFLRRMHRHVGPGGTAVIGADLKKDIGTLIAAYDDRDGVTAAFNLNLLTRINRELGGNFPLDRFAHEARWNEAESAIEMHLVSRDARVVTVAGHSFRFAAGETIHTESSRKYDIDGLAALAEQCGWALRQVWTDPGRLFAVVGLVAMAEEESRGRRDRIAGA
jgi:dimethylhistidine N-methyltransferase